MNSSLSTWSWPFGGAFPVRRGAEAGETNPMALMRNELDRMLDTAFRAFPFAGLWPENDRGGKEGLQPRLDFTGDDTKYTLTVELPGVDPEGVSVEMRDGSLILSGEKHCEQTTETTPDNQGVYRMERCYGSFRRVVPLPDDVQEEGIRATQKHGVLTIVLPRREQKQTSVRKIDIQKAE